MIKKELEKLIKKQDFLDHYREGVAELFKSGIFDVLRLLGQPSLVYDGKDQSAMAAQAARSVGWNAAINTILNFEDILIEVQNSNKTPTKSFDGLELAVVRGDLLKEEADAIRNGSTPNPDIYKPKPTPTTAGSRS